MFYRNFGDQIVLSLGLLSILLLPLEKYATSDRGRVESEKGESEEGEDDLKYQLSMEDV